MELNKIQCSLTHCDVYVDLGDYMLTLFQDLPGGDDLEPCVRERGNLRGCPSHGDRSGAVQDHSRARHPEECL